MEFQITKDYIDDGLMEGKGTRDHGKTEMPHRFRLLDDDGEIYFEGIASAEGFGPLDDFGRAYGCTEIQYHNQRTLQWETL